MYHKHNDDNSDQDGDDNNDHGNDKGYNGELGLHKLAQINFFHNAIELNILLYQC